MHTSNSVYNFNKLEIRCNCIKGIGINIQCTHIEAAKKIVLCKGLITGHYYQYHIFILQCACIGDLTAAQKFYRLSEFCTYLYMQRKCSS